MKIEKFQSLSLEKGNYLIIPESELKPILVHDLKLTDIFEIPELSLFSLVVHHRIHQGLSQQQLADKLDIGKKHLQRIENPKDKHHITRLDPATAKKFCKVLGTKFLNGLVALGYQQNELIDQVS